MKRIYNIVLAMSIILLTWVIASYVNTITHNMIVNYTYPVWNLFTYLY